MQINAAPLQKILGRLMGPFHLLTGGALSILQFGVSASRMLGVNQDEGFKEAVRLYLMLHADHEGATPPMMQISPAFSGRFGMLRDWAC